MEGKSEIVSCNGTRGVTDRIRKAKANSMFRFIMKGQYQMQEEQSIDRPDKKL